MFNKILLAVDGSDHSQKAAKLAGNLARLSGGSLQMITAYDEVPSYLGEPNRSQAIAERSAEAQKIIDESTQEIGDIPSNFEAEILSGDPAETILRVIEVNDIDLVILGTRGRGGIKSLLLGSQSHKVVSAAPCPVLLVR
jgi:nucleotide-binding universal stress UspA family protein